MRKCIWTLMLLLAFMSLNISAQESEESTKQVFSEGTSFIYLVNYMGNEYLFISTILEISGDNLKIKWLISNNGSQGTLSMSAEALQDATALHNYFISGDYSLSDKTSGWVSQKVVQQLKESGKVSLDLGNDEVVDFSLDYQGMDAVFENASFFYPVGVDSKYGDLGSFGAYTIENEEKGYEIRIMNSDKHPLILYMNLGWSIKLLAII